MRVYNRTSLSGQSNNTKRQRNLSLWWLTAEPYIRLFVYPHRFDIFLYMYIFHFSVLRVHKFLILHS